MGRCLYDCKALWAPTCKKALCQTKNWILYILLWNYSNCSFWTYNWTDFHWLKIEICHLLVWLHQSFVYIYFSLIYFSDHNSKVVQLMQQLCYVQVKGHNATNVFYSIILHIYALLLLLYNSWTCSPQLPWHVCSSQVNAYVACLMYWTLTHTLSLTCTSFLIISLVRLEDNCKVLMVSESLNIFYCASKRHCCTLASQFPTRSHWLPCTFIK